MDAILLCRGRSAADGVYEYGDGHKYPSSTSNEYLKLPSPCCQYRIRTGSRTAFCHLVSQKKKNSVRANSNQVPSACKKTPKSHDHIHSPAGTRTCTMRYGPSHVRVRTIVRPGPAPRPQQQRTHDPGRDSDAPRGQAGCVMAWGFYSYNRPCIHALAFGDLGERSKWVSLLAATLVLALTWTMTLGPW